MPTIRDIVGPSVADATLTDKLHQRLLYGPERAAIREFSANLGDPDIAADLYKQVWDCEQGVYTMAAMMMRTITVIGTHPEECDTITVTCEGNTVVYEVDEDGKIAEGHVHFRAGAWDDTTEIALGLYESIRDGGSWGNGGLVLPFDLAYNQGSAVYLVAPRSSGLSVTTDDPAKFRIT